MQRLTHGITFEALPAASTVAFTFPIILFCNSRHLLSLMRRIRREPAMTPSFLKPGAFAAA